MAALPGRQAKASHLRGLAKNLSTPIYEELRKDGLIDRILYLELGGGSVYEINAEAVRVIVDAATTEWILLIKLDTLPYRSGHETWLDDALDKISKYHLFGMTGGPPAADLVPLEDGYSTTQKFSENFSIFRRSDWLDVINTSEAEGYEMADFDRGLKFQGDQLRYINEYTLETYMEKTGKRMLLKHESLEWSVFHVNVWGEALQKVPSAAMKAPPCETILEHWQTCTSRHATSLAKILWLSASPVRQAHAHRFGKMAPGHVQAYELKPGTHPQRHPLARQDGACHPT